MDARTPSRKRSRMETALLSGGSGGQRKMDNWRKGASPEDIVKTNPFYAKMFTDSTKRLTFERKFFDKEVFDAVASSSSSSRSSSSSSSTSDTKADDEEERGLEIMLIEFNGARTGTRFMDMDELCYFLNANLDCRQCRQENETHLLSMAQSESPTKGDHHAMSRLRQLIAALKEMQDECYPILPVEERRAGFASIFTCTCERGHVYKMRTSKCKRPPVYAEGGPQGATALASANMATSLSSQSHSTSHLEMVSTVHTLR